MTGGNGNDAAGGGTGYMQTTKKPPFRKRGVGGIYTYTSPGTTANLSPAVNAIGGRGVWRDATGCFALRANPPNPPFAKGGLFIALRQARRPIRPSAYPPTRQFVIRNS